MTPVRIQRKRSKGWRMPEGAVYVGRPSRWGNSAKAGDCAECRWGQHEGAHQPMSAADAVWEYRIGWEASVDAESFVASLTPEENRMLGVSGRTVDLFADIRGRDLACWCPLDRPCHADVLLDLANR